MTFPSPSTTSASDTPLQASDFAARPVTGNPRPAAPAVVLGQAGGPQPPAMTMTADAEPAHLEDHVQPDSLPDEPGACTSRYGLFLQRCGLKAPQCATGASLVACCASRPLLAAQICGYGWLAGGGLNTAFGVHDALRGPEAQCMPELPGRIHATAGLTEASVGMASLALVGELGAASSLLLPLGVGAAVTCFGLTLGQACYEC